MARLEDKEDWKNRVGQRMEHLYRWVCQKGHKYVGEEEDKKLEKTVGEKCF